MDNVSENAAETDLNDIFLVASNGSITRPQMTNPARKIPFERKKPANVKHIVAGIHWETAQYNMPLYDKKVKNGSAYAAKCSVGGLLGRRDKREAKKANDGEPK